MKRTTYNKKAGTRLLLLCICVMLLPLSACSNDSASAQDEEKITLTYAFFAPGITFPAVQMNKWAEELEKRTNGKVKVDMFFGGTLLNAQNMFSGIEGGVADIGLTSTTYEPGRFPLLEISDLPSGYPNAEVASLVARDLINEYPPESIEGFKILTVFATEPSYIQSAAKISSLDEISGKQLRVSGGITPIMKSLGAAPVAMSQAEVSEALQTSVIEGVVSSREVLRDLKLAEYVKYVTDYPLSINTFVAVMNEDTWNELPQGIQDVIDELNEEMTIFTGRYLDKVVDESLQWSVEAEGLEVISLSKEEKKSWDQKLKNVQEDAVKAAEEKGLPGREYQKRLYELIKHYSE